MSAITLPTARAAVTQAVPDFYRRSTAHFRDQDRRRAALALGVTFRLAGITSGQRAAYEMGVSESTVSRHLDGEHDSPVSRIRELIRKLTAKGAFPAPILADLLADAWRATVSGKSVDELRAHMKELHRREQEADGRVDCWQTDDLCGIAPASEDAVDEAILGQITRLLEIYTTRQEIRSLTERGAGR